MRWEKRDKLFGTDGIRSEFGIFPLSGDSIKQIAKTSESFFSTSGILIGRDTRESGDSILRLFREGLSDRTELFDAGIVTTPAISFLTSKGGFDLGVMISASHNPAEYNGIKFFTRDGKKMSADDEMRFEEIFYEDNFHGQGSSKKIIHYKIGEYIDFLKNAAGRLVSQKHSIVVDCANGSTSALAHGIFKETGNTISFFSNTPDGKNINLNCGSTYPASLRDKVIKTSSNIGIAYDGDGDRVLMMDKFGRVIDGDMILLILSNYFIKNSKDFPGKIVGTIMTNMGLEISLNKIGMELVRSDVGDRNVFEMMEQCGSLLGGEQSGHIILGDYCNSGDGILTSLMFLNAIEELSLRVEDVFKMYEPFPQKTVSIPIVEKRDIGSWTKLLIMIENFNKKHGNNSRIVIRYSGTEPRMRLMIESEDPGIVEENIEEFRRYIFSEIGGEL